MLIKSCAMYLENFWGCIVIAPEEVDKLSGVGSQAPLILNSWQLRKGMQEQPVNVSLSPSIFLSFSIFPPLPLHLPCSPQKSIKIYFICNKLQLV